MNHSNARTVAKGGTARKQRFLAALRIAGITMEQWAVREGSTQGYVSNLLAGRRTHPMLERKIDAFASKHLSSAA